MVTAITNDIKITVQTIYQDEQSDPENEHFMFAYRIEIENLSDYAIQLLSRKWSIFDTNGTVREVEGEGVVGLQPVIEPGTSHAYISGCNLKTELGSMQGHYVMQRLVDESLFNVNIPRFELVVPYKLN